jgi:hypothetical protein
MSIRKYISTKPLSEIIKYHGDPKSRQNALTFIGSVRKHPYDDAKMLLITKPFTADTEFYEFRIEDIVYYEEQPSIATEIGENLFMAKIWVRKGSIGIQYHPFEVSEEIRFLRDSEVLHQVMTEKEN